MKEPTEQACTYVCYVTLESQAQPLYVRPYVYDLLALVCTITKRGSVTPNRSPADIITQSDMDMAATVMDWSFRLRLWLESK